MRSLYIGIDNGVTGSIGLIGRDFTKFLLPPTRMEQDFTRSKVKNITRIVFMDLVLLFKKFDLNDCFALLELPFTNSNPKLVQAVISAARSWETTLNTLEYLDIKREYIPSKNWQANLLPKGTKGKALKSTSRDIGIRLFPECVEQITKHGDADGLLIAEYARRNNL